MSSRSLFRVYLILKGFLCLLAGLVGWLVVDDSTTAAGLFGVSLVEFVAAAVLGLQVRLGVI